MSHKAADGRRYELSRVGLADGAEATVNVVHPRRTTRARVTCFEQAQRLDHWCGALPELARLLLGLGATGAINLDGGGSATLVHRGHLLNRAYCSVDQPGPESRPVITALLFNPSTAP